MALQITDTQESTKFIEHLNLTIDFDGLCLINEFFITFSRFECALKASGFANGNVDKVEPNWDTFTSSIKQSFDNNQRTEPINIAIEYLSNNPPKIQNYENDQLGWRKRDFQNNVPLINKLSLSIRDVRNNLFHGGKFNGNYEKDVSRNYKLLKYSIEILNHWLNLNKNVRENFQQPIE